MSPMALLAAAALRRPTLPGLAASLGSIGVFACVAGAATAIGACSRFVRVERDTMASVSPLAAAASLARALVVPSLVEEVFWRVVLQPPGTPLTTCVCVNAAFALSHVAGGVVLSTAAPSRAGARAVFRDPAFLAMAFVLGNLCSLAYVNPKA